MSSRRERYNEILQEYDYQGRGRCQRCGRLFGIRSTPGRKPVFCSNACKQAMYRKLKAENGRFAAS